MTPLAVATMILVLSVVWGGLALCIVTALRREARKDRESR